MKTIISAFLALFFFLSHLSYAEAQEAAVYGRIFLPAVEKKQRTFRGRIYRNRLAAAQKTPKSEQNDRNPLEDVIIAAYPLSFKPEIKPLEKARVLQKNATFIPHVLPVTPGTRVEFINLDRFYHNVFSISPDANFNIGRRPTNTIVSRTINKTGEVKLFCDIHSQMNATILSLETPYFTRANRNGVYLLDDLPPGRYRIEVYHPDLPTVSNETTLEDGDKQEQSFTLTR